MATVLNRVTKELKRSANTPDYPVETHIHSPNLNAVAGWPSIYWIITGDVVTLMTPPERAAVDSAIDETRKDSLSANLDKTLKAFVLALNKGTFVPGQNYSKPALKAIIKAEL